MEDKKVLVFLVDGFEEIEAMAPIDLLRRAGIVVDTVSINEDKKVVSSRKITVLTDKTINEINLEKVNCSSHKASFDFFLMNKCFV